MLFIRLQVLDIDLARHVEARIRRVGRGDNLSCGRRRISCWQTFCLAGSVTCLVKSWGKNRTTSIVACSFSRRKDAQRSSGVADPPIHKSCIELVK